MVQRMISDKRHCRPAEASSNTVVDSSNDDSNRTHRLSETRNATNTVSLDPLQARLDQVREITYTLDSGEEFHATRTHPEHQRIHNEDSLTRRLCYSCAGAIEDSDDANNGSESRQAHGLPKKGRRDRTSKRKRRGPMPPISALERAQRSPKIEQGENKSDDSSEDEEDDDDDDTDELAGAETEWLQIRVDEALAYYDKTFRSVMQLPCKDIAKTWIWNCDSKKQTTHPYNGGKSLSEKARSNAEYGYPGHFTRPDYWPSDKGWQRKDGKGVRHTEPDHLSKPERIALLLHLLRSQGKRFKDGDFSLENLKASTVGIELKCGEHWRPEYVDRLNDIYRMREKELAYERGEIDGDTLVPVQMPKPRSKAAAKAAVKAADAAKAAKARRKRVKKEPEQTGSATGDAPMANMRINMQIDAGNIDPGEGSEPTILGDTSSSTEDIAPEPSCPERLSRRTRTSQRRLPSHGLPQPKASRQEPVHENWTPQTANLGQHPTVFTQPHPFGHVVAPSEAQRSLPVREQYPYEASMQGFPSRVVGRQNVYSSPASHPAAYRMRPSETFARNPPAQPGVPKKETVRNTSFTSSSTGLQGAYGPNFNYSNSHSEDYLNTAEEPRMYTDNADPNVSLSSYANGPFSSAYGDTQFLNGLPLDTVNRGNQILNPYHHTLDDPLQFHNLQDLGVPTYDHFGINAVPPGDNPYSANWSGYTPHYRPNPSSGAEPDFDPFSQNQRQP